MKLLVTFMHNIKSRIVYKFTVSSYIFSTLRKIMQEVLSTLDSAFTNTHVKQLFLTAFQIRN